MTEKHSQISIIFPGFEKSKEKNTKKKEKNYKCTIYTWVLFQQITEKKDFKVYEKTLNKENEILNQIKYITHELIRISSNGK